MYMVEWTADPAEMLKQGEALITQLSIVQEALKHHPEGAAILSRIDPVLQSVSQANDTLRRMNLLAVSMHGRVGTIKHVEVDERVTGAINGFMAEFDQAHRNLNSQTYEFYKTAAYNYL